MKIEIRIQWNVRAAARTRAARRFAAFAAVALLSTAGVGCLGASSEPDALPAADSQRRGERIEELRRAIDRDHATLEGLITRPPVEGGVPLYDDPELRAIAIRLTDQERALERLEAAARAER